MVGVESEKWRERKSKKFIKTFSLSLSRSQQNNEDRYIRFLSLNLRPSTKRSSGSLAPIFEVNKGNKQKKNSLPLPTAHIYPNIYKIYMYIKVLVAMPSARRTEKRRDRSVVAATTAPPPPPSSTARLLTLRAIKKKKRNDGRRNNNNFVAQRSVNLSIFPLSLSPIWRFNARESIYTAHHPQEKEVFTEIFFPPFPWQRQPGVCVLVCKRRHARASLNSLSLSHLFARLTKKSIPRVKIAFLIFFLREEEEE